MNRYILKNGRIIDVSRDLDGIADVFVADGKIAQIEPHIEMNGVKQIDCTGLMILPGLIDMHAHIYPVYPRFEDSLPSFDGEAFCIRNGVTTCVDAGTCGLSDFQQFYDTVIQKTKLNYYAFLNIADGGMVHLKTEQDPKKFHIKEVADIACAFSDVIVGIKSAHYWVGIPFDDEHKPWASVDATVKAGELSGLPVMIDFQPNGIERTYEDLLLKHMRPGDIHTHLYAQQFHYFDENIKLLDFIYAAQEKDIRFDLGHGRRSFWFRNSIPAIEQGFKPHTISTDLYSANACGPVLDMMNVMSKLFACGMSLKEIIKAVTITPARTIGKPELGTLEIGRDADIAVIKKESGSFGFEDGGRTRLSGHSRFSCQMTIKNGEILFDRECASLGDWKDAPQSYWNAPGIVED